MRRALQCIAIRSSHTFGLPRSSNARHDGQMTEIGAATESET
jgi:hypothetical protein